MLAPIVHILPLTRIRRHRILPVNGRVLIRKGQKLDPLDVIAEANLEPRHVLLDIAQGLGIAIGDADKYIEREVDDRVNEGDVLAGPVGWTKRLVRSPCSGKVVLAGRGKILLEEERKPFKLKAGLPGVVSSLIPGRGAVVESVGSLVQGVWGNGLIDSGSLSLVIKKPEDILSIDKIDIDLREKVVLGGYCGDENVLQALGELPVKGLVLSSMAASLIPKAEGVQFPVVVVEGFGLLSLNQAAYSLLTTSRQREVTINAERFDAYANKRPEIFIYLPVDQVVHEPREFTIFSPEQRVRVLRAPYQSQIGTLIGLKPGLSVLPNGLKALAAEIELENSTKVNLPLANLEVLE
jgi:hypothetical protein